MACRCKQPERQHTMLDVWDFGNDDDDEWVGEGCTMKTARTRTRIRDRDVDAMDQDLVASESESVDIDETQSCLESDAAGPADSDVDSLDRSEAADESYFTDCSQVGVART